MTAMAANIVHLRHAAFDVSCGMIPTCLRTDLFISHLNRAG